MNDYPWLIAECGVNWDTVDQARDMIRMCAQAGFRFVKFQLYDRSVTDKIEDPALRQKLVARSLDTKAIRALVAEGRANRVEVFFTAMFPEAFWRLSQLSVPPWVKIRCADEHNIELWQACSRYWHSNVFYSTTNPAAGRDGRRIPLFCVPKYPAAVADYEPLMSEELRGRIGVSLHAPDIDLLERFILLEPIAIEVHVRRPEDTGCIDANVSLTISQVAGLVKKLRDEEEAEKQAEANAVLQEERAAIKRRREKYRARKEKQGATE